MALANGIKSSSRMAHTDKVMPDLGYYRMNNAITSLPGKEFVQAELERKEVRRAQWYTLNVSTGILGVYTAKSWIFKLVGVLQPSKDILALASVEIDISAIPEGKTSTFKWRGKPLFIKHLSGDDIKREKGVNVDELRHAQAPDERQNNPSWLVVIAICTHLGCVPIANAGDFSGFYCPCHGSHYDAVGRIRQGPAPLNLEVPPHSFVSDGLVKVG